MKLVGNVAAGWRSLMVLCIGALLSTSACEENDRASKEGICERFDDCNALTYDECIDYFDARVLTLECREAIASASCLDHTSSAPSYLDLCWPPCTGAEVPQECGVEDGRDVLTNCVDSRVFRTDCQIHCESTSRAYSGICGPSYNGESRPVPVCWCEEGARAKAAEAIENSVRGYMGILSGMERF